MLSDEQIHNAHRALESGLNLDPPREVVAAWAEAGNHDAMIESHHWLLVAKARQARASKEMVVDEIFRDYVRAGYAGLLHTAKVFEPERGYKFGTWATRYIADAIAKHIASVHPRKDSAPPDHNRH